VVLAEHAAQVAAGEEDGARAVPSPQAVLLAEVREVRRNNSRAPDPTQAFDVMQPVNPAQPRADTAPVGTEQNPGLHGPPRDLVDAEADIRGARSDAVHGSLSSSDPTRPCIGLVTRCRRASGASGAAVAGHRAGRWRASRWPHSVMTSSSRATNPGCRARSRPSASSGWWSRRIAAIDASLRACAASCYVANVSSALANFSVPPMDSVPSDLSASFRGFPTSEQSPRQ
jgi:hypothetical protein